MQKNIRKLLSIGLTAAALAVSTFASASTDLSGKSWSEIEELAKKEGKLTVSVWYLQPQFRNFVKEFENQYGIKVKVPEGTLDGNINKLIAEKNLETGKMDVVVLNADRLGNVAKNDILVKLNNLPNFDKLNHHLQGVELGDMAVGYWGNQTGLAYDPMRIKEEELPQSWADMESYIDKNPKKFGYSDPNGGSSGNAFIQRALVYINGDYDYRTDKIDEAQIANWKKTWDWFSSKKDALIRTASNADSLTRLNDGELVIVSAWQDHLFSLQKQGAITDRLGNVAKNDILVKLNNLPNFDKLNHHLQGVELGDMAVGYWGNQTGLAYDPMRIKEEELPQSWADMESYIDKNPKKFGYSDPNGGSSGNAFIQRALVYINGDYDYRTDKIDEAQIANWKKTWDWFSSKKDALIRTASNADSLTRLNDGELVIVSAWQDHLFSLQKQGAITDRLKFYVPKFGMPGGGNVVTVAKNAPNPAASLVFVHWITSPEVQQKLSQEFGVRPLNSESGLKDTIFFSTPWRKAEMEAFTKEVISR